MRAETERLLALARDLPVEALPSFLGELETVRVTALVRFSFPQIEPRDQLLEVGEAAARLSVSPAYLYRNSRRLPFTRRVGRKLLFSALGLDAYLRKPR